MKTAERMILLRQLTDRQAMLLKEQAVLNARLVDISRDVIVLADQIHTTMVEHLSHDDSERAR